MWWTGGAIRRREEAPQNLRSYLVRGEFDNRANPAIHQTTTTEEIWSDCGGIVNVVVAGAGTDGTITGIGPALKPRNCALRIIAVDPRKVLSYQAMILGLTISSASVRDFIPSSLRRPMIACGVRRHRLRTRHPDIRILVRTWLPECRQSDCSATHCQASRAPPPASSCCPASTPPVWVMRTAICWQVTCGGLGWDQSIRRSRLPLGIVFGGHPFANHRVLSEPARRQLAYDRPR